MAVQFAICEAFIVGNQGYTGNPAAIVFLESDDQIPDDIKQKIANTMNLSETAFVSKAWSAAEVSEAVSADTSSIVTRTLRWFTPLSEVNICGHATLASARALLAALSSSSPSSSPPNEIHFRSKYSGVLKARLEPTNQTAEPLITLDFPINVPEPLEAPWLTEFLQASVAGDAFPGDAAQYVDSTLISPKMIGGSILVKLKLPAGTNPETLIRSVEPQFERLKSVDTGNSCCLVIITVEGAGNDGPHFYSRVFAPWLGINEDPVCGSAHTILAPFWNRLRNDVIDANGIGPYLVVRQASPRGGDIRCRVVGDRVELTGKVKLFCQGQMNV